MSKALKMSFLSDLLAGMVLCRVYETWVFVWETTACMSY